jgi:hypothetical protein
MMAELIAEGKEASMRVFTMEMTEDEMALFVASLDYLLKHLGDKRLERILGAYRDEVEGICDDLRQQLDEPIQEILETQPIGIST